MPMGTEKCEVGKGFRMKQWHIWKEKKKMPFSLETKKKGKMWESIGI